MSFITSVLVIVMGIFGATSPSEVSDARPAMLLGASLDGASTIQILDTAPPVDGLCFSTCRVRIAEALEGGERVYAVIGHAVRAESVLFEVADGTLSFQRCLGQECATASCPMTTLNALPVGTDRASIFLVCDVAPQE